MKKGGKKKPFGGMNLKKSVEEEEEEKIQAMKYTETGSIQLHGINRDGKKTSKKKKKIKRKKVVK